MANPWQHLPKTIRCRLDGATRKNADRGPKTHFQRRVEDRILSEAPRSSSGVRSVTRPTLERDMCSALQSFEEWYHLPLSKNVYVQRAAKKRNGPVRSVSALDSSF